MAEISVPDPDNLLLDSLTYSAPAQVNRSQWTRRRQVVALPGAELWRAHATIDAISTEQDERPWRAFLFGLKGPANWFRLVLPCNSHTGSRPTIGSSPGSGYSLPLAGMAPSATILLSGQFMTVPLPSGHYRAVMLTADLVTNGSGAATASFLPNLGEIPTVGATVETLNPFVPMALVADDQALTSSQGVSGASFDIEEAR